MFFSINTIPPNSPKPYSRSLINPIPHDAECIESEYHILRLTQTSEKC